LAGYESNDGEIVSVGLRMGRSHIRTHTRTVYYFFLLLTAWSDIHDVGGVGLYATRLI
jgi:hypothetical protein